MGSANKLMTLIKNQVGTAAFTKAQETLGIAMGNGLRVPIEQFTDDEDALEIMRELELNKPENMVKFMIESFYAGFEEIQSAVIRLQFMMIEKELGYISGAKRMYDNGVENPDFKVDSFNAAQNQLFNAVSVLEKHVSGCISETRRIDNLDKWKFFIKANENMKTIDANINMIRLALDAIENAVSMQILIANELGKKIEMSVIRPYEEFYDNILLTGDTCRLLDAYEDKDKKSEKYFLRLSEKRDNIRNLKIAYEEYVDELEGYDNIIF